MIIITLWKNRLLWPWWSRISLIRGHADWQEMWDALTKRLSQEKRRALRRLAHFSCDKGKGKPTSALVWKENSERCSGATALIHPSWCIVKMLDLSFCPMVPDKEKAQFRTCHTRDMLPFINPLFPCNMDLELSSGWLRVDTSIASCFNYFLFSLPCVYSLASQHSSHFREKKKRKALDNLKHDFNSETEEHCECVSLSSHRIHHITGAVWFLIALLPVKTPNQFAVQY